MFSGQMDEWLNDDPIPVEMCGWCHKWGGVETGPRESPEGPGRRRRDSCVLAPTSTPTSPSPLHTSPGQGLPLSPQSPPWRPAQRLAQSGCSINTR